MRVSSRTTSFSRGTLRSSRTSTRLPRTWRSRSVRKLAIGGGSDVCGRLREDVLRDVGQSARVPPLVVIPERNLHEIAVGVGEQAVDDRGVRILLEVAGDQRLLDVLHQALEVRLGSLAQDS